MKILGCNAALRQNKNECDTVPHSRSLTPAFECLSMTHKLMGFYKFNDDSGGQLLHLHSRYSEEKSAPAKTDFPTDYFSPKNVQHEVLLANLKEWAFGRRDDLCASGITEDMSAPLRKDLALSLLTDRSMKNIIHGSRFL